MGALTPDTVFADTTPSPDDGASGAVPAPAVTLAEPTAQAMADAAADATPANLASTARTASAALAGMVALVELLERDGHVRQSVAVPQWPLSLGRALDNTVVLPDPHVAARHLRIEPAAIPGSGLLLTVGDTVNGLWLGSRRLGAGECVTVPEGGAAVQLTLGRTHVRVRLPGQALAPEQPLAEGFAFNQRLAPLLVAAAVLVAALGFNTYLDSDPDNLARALGGMALASIVGAAVWCGLWALLSKTFTRQSQFGWHLKVFMLASMAWMVADVAPRLLAFMFSRPMVSSFAFVGTLGVGAAALYFHLLAVEPARPRLLRWVVFTGWVVGVLVMLMVNLQRSDRLGEELYMSHLFPPALRLARPVNADQFMEGLAPLQGVLDKKAKQAPTGDSNGGRDEE